MDLAKVWPLRSGVVGCTYTGQPVQLQPGMPGWMEYEDAVEADARGDVQIMAGQTPESLKTPSYEACETREMRAQEPVARNSRQPPRKKKAYSRRDMVAERPDD